MKVTIVHALDGNEGQIPERRTLGELEFAERQKEPIPLLALPDARIAVDDEAWLVLHSAYSPHNQGLSVMVEHHRNGAKTHVFTGMSTWGPPPPYFAFRLPAGEFIELYFQPDDVRSTTRRT